MRIIGVVAATILSAAVASAAAATPILSLAGLSTVRVYETTTSLYTHDFAASDPTLSAASGTDFATQAFSEIYDVFVSDAQGHLKANGGYVTINGRCDSQPGGGCFNINAVSLTGTDPRIHGELFATILTYVVYGQNAYGGYPASNAVDGDLTTYTVLGDTATSDLFPGPFPNMSITVGFAGISHQVPEPATWAMMTIGLFGLGGVLRRDRRVLSTRPARSTA